MRTAVPTQKVTWTTEYNSQLDGPSHNPPLHLHPGKLKHWEGFFSKNGIRGPYWEKILLLSSHLFPPTLVPIKSSALPRQGSIALVGCIILIIHTASSSFRMITAREHSRAARATWDPVLGGGCSQQHGHPFRRESPMSHNTLSPLSTHRGEGLSP